MKREKRDMEKTYHVTSFVLSRKITERFKMTCKVLGKSQSEVLNDLMNNYNVTNKASANEKLFEIKKIMNDNEEDK